MRRAGPAAKRENNLGREYGSRVTNCLGQCRPDRSATGDRFGKEKAHSVWGNEQFSSCFQASLSRVLRLMGESDPTASQPPKPVCDWSVGPRGVEVKDDFPALAGHSQLAPNKPFIGQPVFPQSADGDFSTGGKG